MKGRKKTPHCGVFLAAKNYFLGASAGAAAAGAAASAGLASAAGAAGAAGASAAGAAAAGAGAGAAASSFLPQAAKAAAAAITAAKTIDLFMIIFLKVSDKTISGKLSSGLVKTLLTEQQALELLPSSLKL
jgi:hypothetical protein